MQPDFVIRLSSKIVGHDGCRLQVHRWGRSGPTCLFIHGLGEGSYIWDDFAPAVLPRYQSVTVDLRGHGDSDWARARRYDLESHARDIECLMDDLDLKCVAIIGHSLGGRIATLVAAARPADVFAVVLADSGPELRRDGVAQIQADLRESCRTYATVEDYVEWLRRRRALVSREQLQRFAMRSLRRRADGAVELKFDPGIVDQAEGEDADAGLWKAVAKLNCMVLVLRGVGSSVLSHDAAIRTMQASRFGRLRTIDRAGHGLVVENATAFSDEVHAFLADAVAASAVGGVCGDGRRTVVS